MVWNERHEHIGLRFNNNEDCCPLTSASVRLHALEGLLRDQDPVFRIGSVASLHLKLIAKDIVKTNLNAKLE